MLLKKNNLTSMIYFKKASGVIVKYLLGWLKFIFLGTKIDLTKIYEIFEPHSNEQQQKKKKNITNE